MLNVQRRQRAGIRQWPSLVNNCRCLATVLPDARNGFLCMEGHKKPWKATKSRPCSAVKSPL